MAYRRELIETSNRLRVGTIFCGKQAVCTHQASPQGKAGGRNRRTLDEPAIDTLKYHV